MSRLTLAALVLFSLFSPAFAAPPGAAGTTPVAECHAAAELTEFEAMVAALCDAYEDRMPGRYREVNARVQRAMSREIEQARVERDRAVSEERRSRSRRDSGPMRAETSAAAELPFEKPRDTGADRRARRSIVNRCDEMVRVGTLSGALQNEISRGSRPAMARNIELVRSFLCLMRADARI
jgi:hypothetical protein